MATTFPGALDAFTNPTANSKTTDAGVVHSEQHANANDAIEALQAKVGIDGSTVTTSHEFRLSAAETTLAGKQETLVSGTNIRSINGASLVGNGNIQFPVVSAFVRFDGSTGVIKSGYNVSSVTKTATGTYVIGFSTPLPNANYSLTATTSKIFDLTVANENGAYIRSTGSVGIVCSNAADGTAVDGLDVSVMVFGI